MRLFAMKEKLEPVLNDLACRVHLATIHSFCHFLLKDRGAPFQRSVRSRPDHIPAGRDEAFKVKDLAVGMGSARNKSG